jgi:hypothetical protein
LHRNFKKEGKMKRIVILLVLGAILFSSCVRNKNPQQMQQTVLQSNQNVFEVSEVVQGDTYTYLKVKENAVEKWVAITRQEINKGDVLYYEGALEMNNFHSKEVDRTFETIYFVSQISKTPISQNSSMESMMGGMQGHSGKVESESAGVKLEKPEGELTIASLFENRTDFTDTEFEIRGVVVKVNNQIMGKNWVHIQDGTISNGNYDLTVTTQENVQVGDEVTFKGKLTLDKNFGSGYFYDVIVEDGVLVNKTVS